MRILHARSLYLLKAPTRSRGDRVATVPCYIQQALSTADRPYDTNEVSHKAEDESETAKSKDAEDFFDERVPAHELFRKAPRQKGKRSRSIRCYVLKSRKPILSSAQRPSTHLDERKGNSENWGERRGFMTRPFAARRAIRIGGYFVDWIHRV